MKKFAFGTNLGKKQKKECVVAKSVEMQSIFVTGKGTVEPYRQKERNPTLLWSAGGEEEGVGVCAGR